MHAVEKLEQDVTITMPVKFLTTIVRSLVDGAELHQLHLAQATMEQAEFVARAAIIKCYGEVYEHMSEAMGKFLTSEDIEVLRRVATASVTATPEDGVLN